MTDNTAHYACRCSRGGPSNSSRIRSRGARSQLALVLLLAHSSQPSHGFSPVSSQRAPPRSLPRRNFRHADDADTVAAGAEAAVDLLKFTSQESSVVQQRMPTWLRQPRGHLAERNLALLREALVSTYLSDIEADAVLRAIHEAADGDRNKVAGAAEFCRILVEVMEMDESALVAGAFHYCTCVTARERGALSPPSGSAAFSPASFWDHHESGTGVLSYGVHASRIARDAARLKRTETLAASALSSDARDSANLLSLLLSETNDWRALAIRSAACLYRLRGLLAAREEGEGIAGGEAKLAPLTHEEARISREALNIYAPLASRLGMHRLKNELEGAAFRIRYRRQYRRVSSLALQRRTPASSETCGESLRSVLDEVTERVTEALRDDATLCKYADRVAVSARVKEPYSLWRKMLRTGAQHILDVPDSLALRVVLGGKKFSPDEDDGVTRARERALCYYVQKRCVDRFSPLGDGRFKDYVDSPKRNGYQSLHYTAHASWDGQDWPFEIQVRSEDMHRVAEYGVAAHWSYKDQKASTSSSGAGANSSAGVYRLDDSLEAYLRSVQRYNTRLEASAAAVQRGSVIESDVSMQNQSRAERVRARAERIAPYIEALSAAKLDLTRENVFVFLKSSPGSSEGGKILALPSGACVLDALREGERRFGVSVDWRNKSHEGVTHNGVVASNVTHKLHNGDVVTILDAKTLSM